jgi:DNA-binding transcriptional LysR family regulator
VSSRLVACLDEYNADPIEFYALYASRQHLSPKFRVFLDFLRQDLAA